MGSSCILGEMLFAVSETAWTSVLGSVRSPFRYCQHWLTQVPVMRPSSCHVNSAQTFKMSQKRKCELAVSIYWFGANQALFHHMLTLQM